MPERLAGRLMWERTGNGIRVEIPARFNWRAMAAAVLLTAWTAGAWFCTIAIDSEERSFLFACICALAGTLGACAAIGWMIWTTFGRTILTLNFAELELVRTVAGVEWYSRTFSTAVVSNLKFIPPAYIWAFRTDTDPTTTRIQFDANGRTITLATGITEREAAALIDRILDVHSFQKQPLAGS